MLWWGPGISRHSTQLEQLLPSPPPRFILNLQSQKLMDNKQGHPQSITIYPIGRVMKSQKFASDSNNQHVSLYQTIFQQICSGNGVLYFTPANTFTLFRLLFNQSAKKMKPPPTDPLSIPLCPSISQLCISL